MHLLPTLLAAAALPLTFAQDPIGTSSKRGLVFVPSDKHTSDNGIWVKSGTDLTWYYNYGVQPSAVFASQPQADFEFVPMLWGLTDVSFYQEVTALIKSGRNISHVLTYNEPDGSSSTGGSAITPQAAAAMWIKEVEPLRQLGIKVGAPAVTGSNGGFTWLSSFFASCATQGVNCTADFFPIHFYGDYSGLTSHVGRYLGS
jgi:hypothetical protein